MSAEPQCAKCAKSVCGTPHADQGPANCPTKTKRDVIERALTEYDKPEVREFAPVSLAGGHCQEDAGQSGHCQTSSSSTIGGASSSLAQAANATRETTNITARKSNNILLFTDSSP